MLKIHTAQYRYSSSDRLDITVKGQDSIGKVFAPTWDMVSAYKKGKLKAASYTLLYSKLMKKSRKENPEIWKKVLKRKRVTFVCFCKAGSFCHRVLLAEIFDKAGKGKYLGEKVKTELKTIKKNILKVTKGVIVHQVNCQGIMGAGLALQIKQKWPIVFTKYKNKDWELGDVQLVKITETLWLANLAGQNYYGRDKRYTDYRAVQKGFNKLKKRIEKLGYNIPVYVPYKMGCGMAGGDWSIYKDIVKKVYPSIIICKMYREGKE